MTETTQLQPGDALLIVDVQNDFCPGGALPIDEGDRIVPVANRWIEAATTASIPVFASRDWHPNEHVSFDERGGPWPPHCLQDSSGAAFHPDLRLPGNVIKVTKGTRFDQDQNSAFDQTGLATELRARDIRRVFAMGLAQDVCVLATALDARQEGFETLLVKEATRPVSPDRGEDALAQMRRAGVILI
ncbi:MAG: nicotinamidase [Guyparkeria sp.]|uniref:nicotinamidase n=1 Tax=Guyparkeria sp. TaxID=2035736 RepID=UPI00397A2612